MGRSWGLPPYIVYWLYTTVIRPILIFALFGGKGQICADIGITGGYDKDYLPFYYMFFSYLLTVSRNISNINVN